MTKPLVILRIAVPCPLPEALDYLPPEGCGVDQLRVGVRVQVPFRRKIVVGILLEVVDKTDISVKKLKAAVAILDQMPLVSSQMLQLARWSANYYHHAIGEVLAHFLPGLLRQGRSAKSVEEKPKTAGKSSVEAPLLLNAYQQHAVDTIQQSNDFKVFLLDGVTGSGKTEVYLQIIQQVIDKQLQALVLVPEIGLTPQTVARFTNRFQAPIAVLHSKLTEKQRAQAWLSANEGKAAIVIGTRSAIFTPLLKPGIIILDEEHDLSFKQQSGFRYSTRDLAIIRGQMENIPVLLGSATPSLESFYNVKRKRFSHLQLPQRAGSANPPAFHVLDVRNKKLDDGLSSELLQAINQHIIAGGQVLLFLNRRGFAPTLLCHACGWVAKCQHCDANLTVHYQPARLFCHHCNSSAKAVKHCNKCHSDNLLNLGMGTEKLEQALQRHFPTITCTRIDSDSTRRKGSMEQKLTEIHQGDFQLLIGTQMLAKGHHFPNVTLVAIIDVDGSLFSNDFRASERMGQLLIQVAGRAGRAEKPGAVYLQTHHPEHPLIQELLQHGYASFAEKLLQERQATQLPPFAYLALLRADSTSAQAPLIFLKEAAQIIQESANPNIKLLGPMPALMEKRAGRYRAQLLMQTKQRSLLQSQLQQLLPKISELKSGRKIRWSLDVDPLEMS